MRYLILIIFLYSCSNNTDNLPSYSENKKENSNLTDSILQKSNGARIVFHHPTVKKSLVARQITSRSQLDSLSIYIGSRSYDTSCFTAGLYNRYGQISLYRDTAMIDKVMDIHFVLGKCEGLYMLTNEGLMRFKLTSMGKSSLTNLQHKNSRFLNK
jgi:hypothetical protein